MSTESEKIEEAREELERERELLEREREQGELFLAQLKDQAEQLEALPKTIREYVQEISDSAELRVQVEEVLSTTRFFVFNAIHRFQVVPTLEEAITAYANLLFFSKKLIPPSMFVKHAARLDYITNKEYGKFWSEPIKWGKRIFVSRIVMSDIFRYFYDLVHYLLTLRFLTAEEAQKSYVSFVAASETALKEHGVDKK